MTMTQCVQLGHGQQKKEIRKFCEKIYQHVGDLELEQQPDAQAELLDNQLPRRMEKHKDLHSEEAQRSPQGCLDHLLVLAQFAEIAAQSEDSVVGMHTENQNKGSHNKLVDIHPMSQQEYVSNVTADDQECSQELLGRLSADSDGSSQRIEFCYEITIPRLTQIRKPGRCKYLMLHQEKIEDNQCKHQGETIFVSQIKRQAMGKSKNGLIPQEIIPGCRNAQPQGRITRLSERKHQAHSKGNSTVKEGCEDLMNGNLHSNIFKDSNLSVVEYVPSDKISGQASQSSLVRRDYQNHREQQRIARQLRALKTKKLRQQLRIECKSNSSKMKVDSAKVSPFGLTSTANSPLSSLCPTLLKDKDLLSCQQELRKTSGCNKKFRENFGVEKLEGHFGPNESSGLGVKSHENISNRLPVHNDVQNIFFTVSPNNIFQQQCENNVRWLTYMHHKHLKEYYGAVARQHRAERIKQRRASRNKLQNSILIH